MTVSEFAERHRQLSVEESPEPGKWQDGPYQTAMQNIFNEAGVRMAVFMSSSQIGKTSILFNIIAYLIARSTGAITFMLPSEVMAKDYSKARIGPLIRDCNVLAEKVPLKNKNGNTVLFKQWTNGYLRFVGSNNADKLSSFPSCRKSPLGPHDASFGVPRPGKVVPKVFDVRWPGFTNLPEICLTNRERPATLKLKRKRMPGR